MKFNWGTGIFLFYSLFTLSLVYQVYKSTQYDNALVVDNYYEEDLAYQSAFEKKQNSMGLKVPVRIEYSNAKQLITINFPPSMGKIAGSVLFYRAGDQSQDIALDIHTNKNNEMIVPVGRLIAGRWKIKVDWQAQNRAYFDERAVDIIAQTTVSDVGKL